MPMPVRHLRQALPGTACHVACGALLPPNARPTPQSSPAISPVSTSCMPVYAGSLVQLASFGWPDGVGAGRQGSCTSLLYPMI
jgi:hypothetical protein